MAAAAYALNDPILVATRRRAGGQGGGGAGESGITPAPLLPRSPALHPPFVSCDAPNVIIETIKPAEDGDGIIVRLYECERRRGPVALRAGFPLRAAWQTNLLEENEEALAVEDNSVRLSVRPFQVITVRLCTVVI